MTAREKKLPPQKKKPRPHNPHATRETVESIAVAVILAFLFRSFVAEAFVIPTGSMAPTLYGRNRDVTCEKCQYRYAAGASSESISQRRLREDDDDERFRPQILVTSTTCPVCRYEMELDPEHFPNQRSFSGDRILVSKFSYALTDPQRWDVIVFKFPGNAKQNYIKRLIGLPGELLEIRYGNIYSSPLLFHATEEQLGSYVSGRNLDLVGLFELAGIQLSADYKATQFYLNSKVVAEQIDDGDQSFIFWVSPDEQGARIYRSDFQIARKPPHKLRAMLQIVDDTDHIPAELTQANWPSRWQDWSGGGGWEAEPGHFRTRGAASSATWLRYRHLIPTSSDWSTINRTGLMPADVPNRRGRLICDYYAYNDVRLGPGNIAPNGPPVNWANDLAMECELEIVGSGGVVLFDLVKGGAHYTVQIDVATGGAELSITDGEDGFDNGESVARTRTATTALQGPGRYSIRYTNVDNEILLWIDEKLVAFDGPTTYTARPSISPKWSPMNSGDAEPIGVGSIGVELDVTRLGVLRDIYYIAQGSGNADHDYSTSTNFDDLIADPAAWNDQSSLFTNRLAQHFQLEEDQFLPLGDNSPASKDARIWDPAPPYVTRELLTGKAVLIYWPHAWNRPVPFTPNFGRMQLIR